MDLTNTTSLTETQTESTPQPHLTKSLSFTNNTFQHHHSHHHRPPPPPMVVSYKECLKNHAASIGGHALDGCGEFMPTPTATPLDPTSLKCAACGCHRNFHRRDLYDHQPLHLLPPPQHTPSSSLSPSSNPSSPQQQPSPVPYSYYSSAPHMLLALSTGYPQPCNDSPTMAKRENPSARKRSRTKFSQEQKQQMCCFAEKLEWKLQKSDERLVQQFCNEVGVERGVFKVWMHNNKNTLGKKGMGLFHDNNNVNGNVNNGSRVSFDTSDYKNNINGNSVDNEGGDLVSVNVTVDVNGTYSSS